MAYGYNPKRVKNLFDPLRHGSGQAGQEPFTLSRSKIENFLRCPRCFYLDRRLGVDKPPMPPFSLNSAVDLLLKKEFDRHRARGTAHPLMKHYKIEAVPFKHEAMDRWREVDFGRGGIHYLHPETNFDVYGAVDDIWQNKTGELIVVDYKATSKDEEVNLDAEWQRSYKNQLEIYQWLFRRNDFPVSPVGYFVYVNGRRDKEAFDGKLEFTVKVIPYEGDDSWVSGKLIEAKNCLMSDMAPASADDCEYCQYRAAAGEALDSGSKSGGTLFWPSLIHNSQNLIFAGCSAIMFLDDH